jgi:type III secretion system low calcium response chaperone LcrH/SycD
MIQTTFEQEGMALLGVSDEEISPIPLENQRQTYAQAFTHYENEEYRIAAKYFTQLVITDPFSEHYWQGLASSKQMAREYLAAIHAWSMVSLLRESDPLPHFHAAECLIALEDLLEASKALDAALNLCQEDSLREKIHLLKALHYGKS